MASSITVEVKSILTTKQIMGSGQQQISLPKGSSLSDLLDVLLARWGRELEEHLFDPGGGLWPHINIMVNGRHFAFTGRMQTKLEHGDSILIMPPAGGG
jgi:molybdopterin synthase sulfur carrier subunit